MILCEAAMPGIKIPNQKLTYFAIKIKITQINLKPKINDIMFFQQTYAMVVSIFVYI